MDDGGHGDHAAEDHATNSHGGDVANSVFEEVVGALGRHVKRWWLGGRLVRGIGE